MSKNISELYSYLFQASQAGHTIMVDGKLSKSAILAAYADQILPRSIMVELLELRAQDSATQKAEAKKTIQDKLLTEINAMGLGGIVDLFPDPSDGSVTLTVAGMSPLKLTKGKIGEAIAFLHMIDTAREIHAEQAQAPDLFEIGQEPDLKVVGE